MLQRIFFAFLILPLVLLSQNTHASDSEDKVLLAYVYNFGKFVDWPESLLAAEDPIHICFYGSLGDLSSRINALDNKTIKKHPIITKEVVRGGDLSFCQIVFISESEELYFRPILAKLKNKPILTISTSSKFIAANGMIALIYNNDKLRFDINKKATDSAKLALSSQVLRLARKVSE